MPPNTSASFLALPLEVKSQLFCYIDWPDLLTLSYTSKALQHLAEPIIWEYYNLNSTESRRARLAIT
jgi:hypothetical protein